MVGQTQECERAWVGDFNYPTGYLILRHFPAKISNSILMIFLSSVVARWGPKSAQIEKCKVETLLVGPFHIGFKGKNGFWAFFEFHAPPNRSDPEKCRLKDPGFGANTKMRLFSRPPPPFTHCASHFAHAGSDLQHF